MIPVSLAPEPLSFDKRVRQPGSQFVGTLKSYVDADFTGREFWRRTIPELREAYSRICAYTCHWIALDTGGNSVEHFVPKTQDARLAYEWNNLRFVSSRLNARRGKKEIIDPFQVQLGMFTIRFPSLDVAVGEEFENQEILHETIRILKLNDDVSVESREEYVKLYADQVVTKQYLKERAPFIYAEICRYGYEPQDLKGMGF